MRIAVNEQATRSESQRMNESPRISRDAESVAAQQADLFVMIRREADFVD